MNNLFIMRVSPSSNKSKKLNLFIDKIEMLKLVSENVIKYVTDNKYIFKIIVDGNDHSFNLVISDIYRNYAEIIYIDSKSNALSFKKQIHTALENKYDYIEFAEDDYLKFGSVDFSKLNKKIIYTAYNHPDYSKISRKLVTLLCGENLNTVTFSFIISQDLLNEYKKAFLYFDRLSDGLIFYTLTLSNLFFKFYIFKYYLINGNISRLILIKSLRRKLILTNGYIHIKLLSTTIWIHLANDSLVKKYEKFLLTIDKNNFIKFSKNLNLL